MRSRERREENSYDDRNRTKQSLDDLVDTLELLSNPKLVKNLEQGLKEAHQGKAVKLTTRELRKRLE